MYENYICKFWMGFFSFFIVILLQSIIFFPKIWYLQPSWTMMMFIYWIKIFPNQINMRCGFGIGLILDFMLHSTLGTHSLSLSIIYYLVIKKFYFFKFLSMWIQLLFIIFFSFINQSIIFSIKFLITSMMYSPKFFWICILDGGIWPIFTFLIQKIFNLNKKHKSQIKI